ncbi:hypothetical protein BYT27DRAFT_7253025 [Phlegmacium glaucopus]|nr:hypothetical protein BYT27DRAFT_7253025 [Phlegmacium glaucopus]
MDEESLSPTPTPKIHLSKPSGGSTSTGLTLLIPSLKSLKAAKKFKDPPTPSSTLISNANSNLDPFFQDVNVHVVDTSTQGEKKMARPVKLKPLKEVLIKLIAQIKKKDDYAFFLHPVKSGNVPGYADIVKRPMDLGTMSHKVNKGKYRSLEDFANDFKLVTTNAKLFNPPGSIYHIEADRIEVWGLEHIAKAAGTVIQYETDWNIEIEKEEEDEVNVDENENEEDGMDVDERRDRSVSVLSQQQQPGQAGPSGRRGPRGPYKRQGHGVAGAGISETLEQDGGLPGSKDGLGAFPPGSDWAKTALALKLKKKRYKTKKERLRMERDGPPLLADGSLDYTEMEDPFSVLSFFVPEPQTRPHLVPLYPPLLSPLLPQSISNSTSLSALSDAPVTLPHPHTSRAFPSTTVLPLDYAPAELPFLHDLYPRHQNPNQKKQPTIETKKPITVPTSRRRHWTITRNTTSRQKGKEKEDDHLESGGGVSGGGFGGEVPAWQVPREAHAVDFGCFALLEAEMEAEMRRRRLGIGVNGTNGFEGAIGVNGTMESELDGRGREDKEEDVMSGLIRSSLDCSQALRNVSGSGGGEDGLKVGATAASTTTPAPTPTTKTSRTGANLLANAYWTTQRAAEAEDYIRDIVYGGVDGLAYVRSLAEFVGDSGLHRDSDYSDAGLEHGSNPYIYNSELGTSLAKWVEVNLVDPLTQGRHSLIRETALELARLRNGVIAGPSLPPSSSPKQSSLHLSPTLSTDPRTGTIPTQVLASLHFYPSLLLALSSLVHIRVQKIDMGSLIRTPDELFVSEEEWFGKGIKERRAKGKAGGAKGDGTKNDGEEDKMDVDIDGSAKTATSVGVDNKVILTKAVKEEEEEEAAPAKPRLTEYEVEGPEELNEVLDYVAGVIVELDRRNRVNGNGVKRDLDSTDSSESEDPLTRNLRLNLLALAKRAPLDTIARLPLDLVPEHIRHFVPTLAT